jgi:hypothetical protein
MNRFYVYKLIDPRDDTLLYIGKGTGRRRFDFKHRNNKLFYKLRSILKSYNKVDVSHIVEDNLTNEDAFAREIELIAQFDPPYNICRGGEGITPELVTGANNVNYKHIEESEYIKLLKGGKSNKEVVKEMGFTNLNIFKNKFYPNTTLKSYCEEHDIPYYNTQQGSKNGNAKVFPADEFAALIKKGVGLVKASKQLGLSARYCIQEYKKEWGVSSFDELKLVLKA